MYLKIKQALIVLLAGMIAASCSHDADEFAPMAPLFVKTQIVNYISGGSGGHGGGHGDTTLVIHPDTIHFTYDTNGVLASANELRFIYNTDGTLKLTAEGPDTIRYHYGGGLLAVLTTNCGYYDGGRFTDTTRFFYNSGILDYFTSSSEHATTDVDFMNDRPRVKYISRKVGGVMRYDTLEYKWNNGNLVSLRTRGGSPYQTFRYEREFMYDDRPCFVESIHYPKEYLFVREITQFYGRYPLFYYEVLPWRFHCRNNPVEFTEHTSEQTRTREWHVHYNGYGYVSEIHAGDFEVLLEYY